MRIRLKHFWMIGLIGAGCASGPDAMLAPSYSAEPARMIVVVPPRNETVDLDAPTLFHPRVINEVSSKGYSTSGQQDVTDKLATRNVHEGGEIDSLTPPEIGELFGADAILYTTVTGFETITLVAYTQISVSAEFRLVNAMTNETLWECSHEASDTTIAVGRNLGEALVVGLVDTAMAALTPYEPFVDEVVTYCLSSLPNASGQMPDQGCLGP